MIMNTPHTTKEVNTINTNRIAGVTRTADRNPNETDNPMDLFSGCPG
jgi:hypothetical protein